MAQQGAWMQNSRTIELAMFQYATDHGGNYPDGKSSTEVFQKLLDGKYLNDPSLFYIPLPGKTKPVEGQPLKPENVSWDVTSGVDSNTPDELPVIFMTDYQVTYAPGGVAVPLVKPHPDFGDLPRTWAEWWHGAPEPRHHPDPGIAVAYKGGSARVCHFTDPDGTIHDFVPSNFDPKGRVYHQLTPDGTIK